MAPQRRGDRRRSPLLPRDFRAATVRLEHPMSEPVMIVSPSGRVIGFTNEAETASQFQTGGYIAF